MKKPTAIFHSLIFLFICFSIQFNYGMAKAACYMRSDFPGTCKATYRNGLACYVSENAKGECHNGNPIQAVDNIAACQGKSEGSGCTIIFIYHQNYSEDAQCTDGDCPSGVTPNT